MVIYATILKIDAFSGINTENNENLAFL